MIWNGETFYSLNGWQVCKLLISSAGKLGFDFFARIVVPSFGVVAILANPFFWISLFLVGRRRWWGGAIATFIAVLLASVAFWTLADKLLIGFYFWYSSIVAVLVIGLIGALYERSKSGGGKTAVAAAALAAVIGCTNSDPPVTATDRFIAAETANLIKNHLTSLPESHEIVQRYGKFVSLNSHREYRYRASRTLDQNIEPAHLHFWCECSFERFPATIQIRIMNNESQQKTSMPLELVMEPSSESVTTGVLSGFKPELRDGALCYVGGGNNPSQVNCQLYGRINHPEFVP